MIGKRGCEKLIDVYFELKPKKMISVGAVALLEKDTTGIFIWRVYKIYPISERTVLFQRNAHEFSVMDGHFEHEMGTITIKYINGYMNVNVKERLNI